MPKINLTRSNIFLMIIITVGSLLRFYNITSISLWHDEAFSALLIRYPFNEMVQRIILDVHPPLYYILLRFWDFVLGDGLFSLRLFSVFFGILTICFTYLFVKTAFKNERLGLMSAALIAVNSFQIQYATEARMYTLGTFLIMLSSWLLIKAIESQNEAAPRERTQNACGHGFKNCDWISGLVYAKSKKYYWSGIVCYKWWILYGISAALAIYTHYYLIFSVIAQTLFIVFWGIKNYGLKIKEWAKSKNVKGAVIGYAVSLLFFAPWIPILFKQLGQVEENYWIPKMNFYSIPNTIFKIYSGTNIYASDAELLIFLAIFIIIFALALKFEKNDYKWLVASSFLIPFAIAVILSFKRSLYLDRYFVFTGLFYFIIVAMFLNSIKRRIIQNILIVILIIGSILLFARNWQKISPAEKPGMKGASEYLFNNAKLADRVYIDSSFIFFTYKYYAYQHSLSGIEFNPSALIADNITAGAYRIYPEYVTPLLYTPGIPNLNQIPHFSGTALLSNDDLLGDFNQYAKTRDIIWLLWTTGFGSGKPETPHNWKQIDEAGFQDVFDYRGWIVVTKYQVI